MQEFNIAAIKERLRVEGAQAGRHKWFIRPIRRILWPFVRSYFFITHEWTRDRLYEVQQSVARDVSAPTSLRVLELVTAARAEVLASSRTVQELRADMEPLRAEISHVARSADANSATLQRLESALFRLAVRAGMPAEDVPPVASARLGNAVVVDTAYGPMIMKPGDLITSYVQMHGAWDEHILPLIELGARCGDVAVDAGAHFGALTVAMANHFREVHAFEASSENFKFLCANAALQPAGRILPHHLALYSGETTLSLAPPELQEVGIEGGHDLPEAFRAVSNSGGLMFTSGGTGIEAVRAVPLDSLHLEGIGFIKIDCQGADGSVVLGALETIDRCKPIIVFEWEDVLSRAHGCTLDDVRAALEARGYRLEVLRTHTVKQVDFLAMPPSR